MNALEKVLEEIKDIKSNAPESRNRDYATGYLCGLSVAEGIIHSQMEKKSKKIYISGAITGTDDYIERFQTVEERLTGEGYQVLNPAKINTAMPDGTSYEEYMQVCFCLLDMADAIYMMRGWESSEGAQRELNYAYAKRKEVFYESGAD